MKGPLLGAAAAAVLAVVLLAGAMLLRTGGDAPGAAGVAAADPHAGMDMSSAADPSHSASATSQRMPGPESHTPDTGTRIPDPGEITLSPDMIARAGIKTMTAARGTAVSQLHLPGVVEPNAYKAVDVTSLVSGRVTQVRAELGQRVVLGDVLATVYSPELADTQTAFIAANAEHVAHDQRQARANRLFAIGAVSRQELESLEAQKAEMDAKVETLRAKLVLLGIPEERTQRLTNRLDVVTTFDVKAPIAGVVVKRAANQGLNIDPSMPLFTVTDLSSVWVLADLYERDFSRVRLGSAATITTAAYPGLSLRGRVDYIDPQVQAETRTAKLRVEVPNANDRLRFGMFVDVNIGGTSARPVVLVPRTALQAVGSASVVYVAVEPGRFVQREVVSGEAADGQIAILSGIEPGEQVVTEGAFFLHAERERMSPETARTDTPAGVTLPATRP